MKTKAYLILSLIVLLAACGKQTKDAGEQEKQSSDSMTKVELTDEQVKKLGIKVGNIADTMLISSVDVNGKLAIDPQSEATITPQMGGNVKQILVHEGQSVTKGMVVAYLSHPDLVNLQTDYFSALNRQRYLKKEFDRQTMMLNEGVGAGKDYDRTKSELQTVSGQVQMLAAQLKQLGISTSALRKGKPMLAIALTSPINGTVEQINVQMGQYVSPEMAMMKIANTSNMYAELQVFQRDVPKIKVGQDVALKIVHADGTACKGKVYSIGKTFRAETQTVEVRVRLDGQHTGLIVGMYVQAKIATSSERTRAVSSDAIVEVDGKSYIFTAAKQGNNWQFVPTMVKKVKEEGDLVGIETKEPADRLSRIVQSGAYYLLSEMKKDETGEE